MNGNFFACLATFVCFLFLISSVNCYFSNAIDSGMSCYSDGSEPGDDMTMQKVMERGALIPNVISRGPDVYCKLSFTRLMAKPGASYSRTLLQERPSYLNWHNKRRKLFSLILTEVYSKNFLEMSNHTERHKWLVTNIPGDEWMKGKTILEYETPGQLKLGEYYAYLLLVFHHPEPLDVKIEEINNKTNASRESFTIEEFIDKYDLGHAHAGNFFYLYDVV